MVCLLLRGRVRLHVVISAPECLRLVAYALQGSSVPLVLLQTVTKINVPKQAQPLKQRIIFYFGSANGTKRTAPFNGL